MHTSPKWNEAKVKTKIKSGTRQIYIEEIKENTCISNVLFINVYEWICMRVYVCVCHSNIKEFGCNSYLFLLSFFRSQRFYKSCCCFARVSKLNAALSLSHTHTQAQQPRSGRDKKFCPLLYTFLYLLMHNYVVAYFLSCINFNTFWFDFCCFYPIGGRGV